MINRNIATLKTRDQAGSINHFNIDASPWIHDLVIAEILKICPEQDAETAVARRPKKEKTMTAEEFGGVKRSVKSGPLNFHLKG